MDNSKQGKQRKQRKKRKYLYLVFFAILLFLYLVIYTFPDVTGAFTRTKVIEYGSIQVKDQITCWIIRQEEVFYSDRAGTISYYVDEGEQVRKGTRILDIVAGGGTEKQDGYKEFFQRLNQFQNGESLFTGDLVKIDAMIHDLRTKVEETEQLDRKQKLTDQIIKLEQKKSQIQQAGEQGRRELTEQTISDLVAGRSSSDHISSSHGLVSYYVDGYESELTPDNMKLLDREKMLQVDGEAENIKRNYTSRHEPLYKLIQNAAWYAIAWVEPEEISKYSKGSDITLQLPLGPVEGTVLDILEEDGSLMVIFKFDRYYEDLGKLRRIDAEVITLDYKGLTIENKSILNQDNQPGVMVKDMNGEFHFKPVKVITSDGEYSLVETAYYYIETTDGMQKVETVDVYDEILSRP